MLRTTAFRCSLVLLLVGLAPSWTFAQDLKPSLRLPTIAASAAAAADWATTYHALQNYHVRETNPLLQRWQSSPGQLVTVGAAMDVAAISAWNLTMGRKHPRIAAAGLWAMTGFRAYLAIHNMRNTQLAARR